MKHDANIAIEEKRRLQAELALARASRETWKRSSNRETNRADLAETRADNAEVQWKRWASLAERYEVALREIERRCKLDPMDDGINATEVVREALGGAGY